MKTQTVTQIILTAEEGFFLTNGETYGTTVVLPEGADTAAWTEVPEAALPPAGADDYAAENQEAAHV